MQSVFGWTRLWLLNYERCLKVLLVFLHVTKTQRRHITRLVNSSNLRPNNAHTHQGDCGLAMRETTREIMFTGPSATCHPLTWQKVCDSQRHKTPQMCDCQECTTKQSYRLWVISKLSIISWNPVRRTCAGGIYNPTLVTSDGEWYHFTQWEVRRALMSRHNKVRGQTQ